MKSIIITAIILTLVWGWVVYEAMNAPMMDDDGNIIDKKKKK